MSEVLDQSEVDALLAAVDNGGVDAVTAASASPAAATSFESLASNSQQRTRGVDVAMYDFKRPERVSKEQMRALSTLHETFARNFGAALSGYLRTIIEVSVAHIEQLTYSEFIHSLPNPTCFNLLRSEQLDGQLCLEISPLIIYPVIDRLLGGSNADLFIPQRPLTQIEHRLVQRITDRATQQLSEAWTNLIPVKFTVEEAESNPQLVQIVPPNETVVVIGFEMKLGNRAGTMSLCIPYNLLEPIMGILAQQSWFSYQRKGHQDDTARKLRRTVAAAPVELRALLAKTTMTLHELLSLSPGDLITTSHSVDSDVWFEIEGRKKFSGSYGQFRGGKSVRVTKVLAEAPIEDASAAAAATGAPK